ncbi:ferric reductase transmembrane component 5 precursor, putative [Talaromyces stipitatus ATCC 10500]|uniref:Ferric reductase transmembrane component 5, putative n=1 Tax=Talaromyces stipitatus (strain ATCC 10500 / CBS 375.48 / QM 6759 / NRRL 1006) TaxID=441959 RepID=B8MCM7_TALSN|nr:ferric reductase transmembrane component 5 precursor, putative [Talaromyces stipitatus ATCC 10500]EED18843.1 ferric reductase transmembrane component 5 precursor, putative [Talaromyces stipitatus ATCC 10500]
MSIATRNARRILLIPLPGVASVGQAVVIVLYAIVSIVLVFVDMPVSRGVDVYANRTGWLSFLNLSLITFLALRNSPLSFLTGYSYDKLILLHKVAGYSTIFWTILHIILFSIDGARKDLFSAEAKELKIVVGWVGGFAMLIILGTAVTRRWIPYEAFYTSHAALSIVILVTMCFHPDTWGCILVCIITAGFWSADLLIRLIQLFWYSIGNRATLSPLPNGGVRVVMYKSPKTTPGSHCSLWIPSIRLIETHPVAVLSTDPLEFVIASYDGFTGELYKTSLNKKTVWASVHGSYGARIDFTNLEKVVFIAGGSGASFTFALAMALMKSGGNSAKPGIEFIWVVRHQDPLNLYSGSLSWFSNELEELALSNRVNLTIHVSSLSDQEGDVEKYAWSGMVTPHFSMEKIQAGRPDIDKIIDNVVGGMNLSDRLMVAACGPDGLMKTARRSVARNTRPGGPKFLAQPDLKATICKQDEHHNKALELYTQIPKQKITQLARQFDVPCKRLWRRVQGSASQLNRRPAHKQLSDDQEHTIFIWLSDLDDRGLPPTIGTIKNYAEKVLQNMNPDADHPLQLGDRWVYSFIKRLPNDYKKQKQKTVDPNRHIAEDSGVIQAWFE